MAHEEFRVSVVNYTKNDKKEIKLHESATNHSYVKDFLVSVFFYFKISLSSLATCCFIILCRMKINNSNVQYRCLTMNVDHKYSASA